MKSHEIKLSQKEQTIDRLERLMLELQVKVDESRQENKVLQQTKENLILEVQKAEVKYASTKNDGRGLIEKL